MSDNQRDKWRAQKRKQRQQQKQDSEHSAAVNARHAAEERRRREQLDAAAKQAEAQRKRHEREQQSADAKLVEARRKRHQREQQDADAKQAEARRKRQQRERQAAHGHVHHLGTLHPTVHGPCQYCQSVLLHEEVYSNTGPLHTPCCNNGKLVVSPAAWHVHISEPFQQLYAEHDWPKLARSVNYATCCVTTGIARAGAAGFGMEMPAPCILSLQGTVSHWKRPTEDAARRISAAEVVAQADQVLSLPSHA
jgi:hypothetical protein